jgi:hypothetical protein
LLNRGSNSEVRLRLRGLMIRGSLQAVAIAIALSALTCAPRGAAADEWIAEDGWKPGGRPGAGIPPVSVIGAQGTLEVMLGFAALLRLDEPAGTIIIGDPEVIDAALDGASTIVLTGNAVGTTNMIILDAAGREISSLVVQVVGRDRQLVTVHQGPNRETFSCIGLCEPVVSAQEPPTETSTAE